MQKRLVTWDGARLISFHLFICHYGDIFWTENAILFWSKLGLSAVTVSFPQEGTSETETKELRTRWQELLGARVSLELHILADPKPAHASLQHAQSIAELRKKSTISSSHVILADPDLWVIRPDLFSREIKDFDSDDALFLADHKATNLSHACLAVLPREFFLSLELPSEIRDLAPDFGREWYSAHNTASFKKRSSLHEPAQLKAWGGYYYPQVGTLHFSGQSFVGSKNAPRSYRPWINWKTRAPKRYAKKLMRHFRFQPNVATFLGRHG